MVEDKLYMYLNKLIGFILHEIQCQYTFSQLSIQTTKWSMHHANEEIRNSGPIPETTEVCDQQVQQNQRFFKGAVSWEIPRFLAKIH